MPNPKTERPPTRPRRAGPGTAPAARRYDHATRERLLRCGARLFAAHGYDATSLREVTAAARANLASIAYYFKGKAPFYQECFRHLWSRHPSPLLEADLSGIRSRRDWLRAIETVMTQIARLLFSDSPDLRCLVTLMQRELIAPTPALQIVLRELIQPRMRRLEQLLALGMPGVPRRELRARAFSLLGRIMIFNMAWPIVHELFGRIHGNPVFCRRLAHQIVDDLNCGTRARSFAQRRTS